ncbi:MAG: hypothetical protein ACK53Y_21795, partial [bacterium]
MFLVEVNHASEGTRRGNKKQQNHNTKELTVLLPEKAIFNCVPFFFLAFLWNLSNLIVVLVSMKLKH